MGSALLLDLQTGQHIDKASNLLTIDLANDCFKVFLYIVTAPDLLYYLKQ
jgi:hypothetical protein